MGRLELQVSVGIHPIKEARLYLAFWCLLGSLTTFLDHVYQNYISQSIFLMKFSKNVYG